MRGPIAPKGGALGCMWVEVEVLCVASCVLRRTMCSRIIPPQGRPQTREGGREAVCVSPAGLEALELLDEEVLQDLGTLVEGRVTGVVVAAVVKDFGHVRHKLCQLDVVSPLQPVLHGGEV